MEGSGWRTALTNPLPSFFLSPTGMEAVVHTTPTMPPIRVLVTDDHPLSLQSVRTALANDPGMAIVGEASDGKTAWSLLQKTPADVALLDVRLPGIDGLEIASRIGRMAKPIPFLVISMWPDETVYNEAMLLGASGYLHKGCIAEELVTAVRAAISGHPYESPSAESFASRRRDRQGTLFKTTPGLDTLTTQERRVLSSLARNKTGREIARETGSSIETVESHRASAAAKLGIRGGHELLRFALKHRWDL